MSEPFVVAVMLTKNRPLLALRAEKAFRAQTYPNKQLLVWDNSDQEPLLPVVGDVVQLDHPGQSIGAYRNHANDYAVRYMRADIIMHWDDDDWSHPARMEEQVELLMRQANGVQIVGYRDMLFWRTVDVESDDDPLHVTLYEDAWAYTHGKPTFCVGTSLAYSVREWKGRPFPLNSNGEDTQWQAGMPSLGVTLFGGDGASARHLRPRMIAAVHGHNTTDMMGIAMRVGTPELKRVPQWDEYCRREMAL